jgi:hypothetical protein
MPDSRAGQKRWLPRNRHARIFQALQGSTQIHNGEPKMIN